MANNNHKHINPIYKVLDTKTHIDLSRLISVSSIFTDRSYHGTQIGYRIDNYYINIKCEHIESIKISHNKEEIMTETHDGLINAWEQYKKNKQ